MSEEEALDLRVATARDAEAIAALINVAYAVERHFVRGDRIDRAGVLEALGKGTFLVRHDRHRPAPSALDACVYLEPRGRVGYLGTLSIDPGLQGRGLGHRVLVEGERWLAERGCSTIEIVVVDLRTELFPWYEKRGYRRIGTRPFTDVERMRQPCEFVVMRKDVPVLSAG